MSVIQIILGILVLFGSVALIAGTLMTNHRETRTIGGFANQTILVQLLCEIPMNERFVKPLSLWHVSAVFC